MPLIPIKTLGGSDSRRFGRGSDGQYMAAPPSIPDAPSFVEGMQSRAAATLGSGAASAALQLATRGTQQGLSVSTMQRQIAKMQEALLGSGSSKGARLSPNSFSAQPLFGAGSLSDRWKGQMAGLASMGGPGEGARQSWFQRALAGSTPQAATPASPQASPSVPPKDTPDSFNKGYSVPALSRAAATLSGSGSGLPDFSSAVGNALSYFSAQADKALSLGTPAEAPAGMRISSPGEWTEDDTFGSLLFDRDFQKRPEWGPGAVAPVGGYDYGLCRS